VQKKPFADKPARITGKVYEKLGGPCGLEGSNRSDHINLELLKIISFKRSYKQLLAVNNEAVKTVWQLTTPVIPSGRRYETISLALLFTCDNFG
jgi:hypothetical protein